MKHLLAKVGRKFCKVMSSNEIFFNEPDLSKVINYNPSYKLEDDEWYYIDNFLSKDFKNGIIEKRFTTTSFIQLALDEFPNVRYLCAKQGEVFYFQKMLNNQYLVKNRFISIKSQPKLINEKVMVINEYPDAIYNKADDKLFFRDLSKIKIMFKDIEVLYRTATDSEVTEFFTSELVKFGNNYEVSKVGNLNRKRIAQFMDKYDSYDDDEKSEINNYIEEYLPELNIENGKFVINDEVELKNVLFGIDQRFYTTPIKPEKRIANSILVM